MKIQTNIQQKHYQNHVCLILNQKLVPITKIKQISKSEKPKCSYVNKSTCPLNVNCLLKNILYITTITCDRKNYKPINYKGISESTFKKRYANHKRSFNISRYKNYTKLYVKYWNFKAGNSNAKVTWAVKKQFSAYNPQSKRCSFCLKEKFEILEDKDNDLLSKKIRGDLKMLSSKKVYVTNSCFEDPIP